MVSLSELKSRTAHLPPVDTAVDLPPAIRAAAMRASQLHNDAYQQDTPEKKADGVTPAQKAEEVKSGEEGGEGGSQTPAQKAEEGTPGEKTTPAASEGWEQKYNSLKGRYDRQNDTIRDLNARIADLSASVAELQRKPEQARIPSEMTFRKVTEQDRTDFGEDFLEAATRAAEERLGPYIQGLESQIRQLGGTVQSTVKATAETAQARMYATLDEKIPDWRTINRDPKFVAWANLPDPYSGAIRIDMLKDAHSKADANRVMHFFNGFLKDEAASDPVHAGKPETFPTPASAQADGKNKVPLSEFAAPGRAKAPATPQVPGEKETITRAQISAFYRDVNRGKYKGNEAEKDRLERMIFEAEAEGRVV